MSNLKLWQLENITAILDSMKLASLSVLVLVPLAMMKFRRYSVCFTFQNYELSFLKNNAGFREICAFLNCKR